jgi:hypothetical protein
MDSRGRLTAQHSCGHDNIEHAKSCDYSAHGWMQHERPKDGIVAQEVVAIPQAKPREKQQHDAYLEKKKRAENANQPCQEGARVNARFRVRRVVRQRRGSQCSCHRLARSSFGRRPCRQRALALLLNHTAERG